MNKACEACKKIKKSVKEVSLITSLKTEERFLCEPCLEKTKKFFDFLKFYQKVYLEVK